MEEEYYQMGWALSTNYTEEYYFSKNNNNYFIKENTSPIIAVLSAENIVPRLKWIKRLSNGNVLIAQDFENGKTLNIADMQDSRIPEILRRVHNSEKIKKTMLTQGYREETAKNLYNSITSVIGSDLLENKDIVRAMLYLEKNIPKEDNSYAPCHTDVNKDNWLLSDSNKLFLVDWEAPILGDPAIDISFILYKYIPQENWAEWLAIYGKEATLEYRLKLKWYITLQSLILVTWYNQKQQYSKMNEWLVFIKKIFTNYV